MPVPARPQGGGRTKRYCSTRCRVAAHRLRTDPATLHGAAGVERANGVRVVPAPARPQLVYVVPCGAGKLDTAAPARYLYTGAHFRYALARAEAAAARDGAVVRILSAEYGLVDPDRPLAPYDRKLTRGRLEQLWPVVEHQLVELHATDGRPMQVRAFCPRLYVEVLGLAVTRGTALRPRGPRPVELVDEFAGCRGIGDQRAVLATL